MVGFTESATLVLIDKASGNVKKINSSLRTLIATAKKLKGAGGTINFKVNTGQLTKAKDASNKLANSLRGINSRSTTVKVNSSQLTTAASRAAKLQAALAKAAGTPVNVGANVGAPAAPGTGTTNRGGRPRNSRFDNITGSLANNARQAGFYAGLRAVGSGLGAIGDLQNQRSASIQAGFTGDRLTELENAAADATSGMLAFSRANAASAARNLATAGATGDTLETLTRTAALTGSSLANAFDASTAESAIASFIKIADLGGGLDNAQRGEDILQALSAAKIRGGQDFDPKSLLAAVRVSGLAPTLDKRGFAAFAELQDEIGRIGGSGLGRLAQVLTTTSGVGVDKKIISKLNAAGLRSTKGAVTGESGINFVNDPLQWTQDILAPAVDAAIKKGFKGSDLEKAKELSDLKADPAGYATAVKTVIDSFGFSKSDGRTAALLVTKMDQYITSVGRSIGERNADGTFTGGLDFNLVNKLAAGNFGAAVALFNKQLGNLVAVGIDPVAAALAKIPLGAAKVFNFLTDIGLALPVLVAGVAAAGAGLLAIKFGPAIALGAAGLTLSGSAAALSAAAAALTASAAVRGGVGAATGAAAGATGATAAAATKGGRKGLTGLLGAAASASRLTKIGSYAKFAAKALGGVGLLFAAVGSLEAENPAANFAGTLAGGLAGAKLGTAVGAAFGPLGALVGAAILGGIGAAFGGGWAESVAKSLEPVLNTSFGKAVVGIKDKVVAAASSALSTIGDATKKVIDFIEGDMSGEKAAAARVGTELEDRANRRVRGHSRAPADSLVPAPQFHSEKVRTNEDRTAMRENAIARAEERYAKAAATVERSANTLAFFADKLDQPGVQGVVDRAKADAEKAKVEKTLSVDAADRGKQINYDLAHPKTADQLALENEINSTLTSILSNAQAAADREKALFSGEPTPVVSDNLTNSLFDAEAAIGQSAVQVALDMEASIASGGQQMGSSILETAGAWASTAASTFLSLINGASIDANINVNNNTAQPKPAAADYGASNAQ